MVRCKNKRETRLDYHEGFSDNQVQIILRKFDLDGDEFNDWMYGQTCPVVVRHNRETGKEERIGGVYEYDLFRWIENQKTGEPLIFD